MHGVPTVGLRFFNVYGPRQDPRSPYSGVISLFAESILAGRPVRVFGDGLQSRDFVFVTDVVTHLVAAMDRLEQRDPPGTLPNALNVCTGRETTVLQLVELLGEACGRSPSFIHGPARPGDIRRSIGSPTLASATLSVQAQVPLDAGLATTLQSLELEGAASAVTSAPRAIA